MNKFDSNEALRDALSAMGLLHPPWWGILLLVALVMSPFLIHSISKALVEHRKLSHQREESLLKIRNSIMDQRAKRVRTVQVSSEQISPPSAQQRLSHRRKK
jgi:hypothetical protein